MPTDSNPFFFFFSSSSFSARTTTTILAIIVHISQYWSMSKAAVRIIIHGIMRNGRFLLDSCVHKHL